MTKSRARRPIERTSAASILDVRDSLNNQIRMAKAVWIAVEGARHLNDTDAISHLAALHARSLMDFRERLQSFLENETENRPKLARPRSYYDRAIRG